MECDNSNLNRIYYVECGNSNLNGIYYVFAFAAKAQWITSIKFTEMRKNLLFTKTGQHSMTPGPEVIKLFSCSTLLRLKFILLINVKMPTIVGILTFMSRINY